MLFLPEEMSAKLIITEKCGAACLFKMCTEFCFPGTRRLKHIQTIPWILDSFQSAVNSEAHRHLYLSLLSFSFSQTVPSVHLRLVLHCLHFSSSCFFFFCCLSSQKHKFSQNEIQQSPSAHQVLWFAGWHHPLTEEASVASPTLSYGCLLTQS